MKYLFLLIVFGLFSSIQAQDYQIKPDSLYELGDVTVTYTADKTTPISFKTLSKVDIERLNVGQEPSVILQTLPSFTTYSDAGNGSGYSYFRLRGIDQTRLNVTLDGIPLNEPEDQGVYFSNYPDVLNSVSSVQVQRGVGMTQNGTASYGGSVQLSSPSLWDDKYTNVGFGLGSYNSRRMYFEHNTGIDSEFGTYIRGSRTKSDGYRDNIFNDSYSLFYSTGYYKPNYSFKVVSFIGTQKNGQGWLGVPMDKIKESPTTNMNVESETDKFLQGMISLQSNFELNDNFQLQNVVYYNYLDGNYNFDLDAFLGLTGTNQELNQLYNYDLQSNWIGTFTNLIYVNSGVESVTGIHINKYDRRHIGSEQNMGKLYENTGYKNEMSIHQRLETDIKDLTIYGDVQLRHTQFTYDGDVSMDDMDWTFFNPRFGLTYSIGDVNVYGSVGKTGREPTRNDMFGGEDNFVQLYQTDPEFVTDYEGGVRFYGSINSLNVNGYYMDFRNEITLNGQFGPNGIALTQNVESSYRSGIELDYTLNLDNLTYQLNGNFSRNYIEEDGSKFQPILTPETVINQLIDVRVGKFDVGTTLRYQGESYIDFSNTEVLESYFVTDLRISKTFNNLEVSFFVNNITDELYFTNGYIDMFDGEPRYHIQAPRNYYLNLTYNF